MKSTAWTKTDMAQIRANNLIASISDALQSFPYSQPSGYKRLLQENYVGRTRQATLCVSNPPGALVAIDADDSSFPKSRLAEWQQLPEPA
jgi:hypothetical protein